MPAASPWRRPGVAAESGGVAAPKHSKRISVHQQRMQYIIIYNKLLRGHLFRKNLRNLGGFCEFLQKCENCGNLAQALQKTENTDQRAIGCLEDFRVPRCRRCRKHRKYGESWRLQKLLLYKAAQALQNTANIMNTWRL